MTSKSVRSVKLVVKDGKTRLVRKSTLFSGPKKRKADREERAWREKVEKRLADPAIKSVIRENHERAMRIKAGRKT